MASEGIAPFTPPSHRQSNGGPSQRSDQLDSIAKGAISSHVQAFAEIRFPEKEPLEAPEDG